jgi:hypothetical protein
MYYPPQILIPVDPLSQLGESITTSYAVVESPVREPKPLALVDLTGILTNNVAVAQPYTVELVLIACTPPPFADIPKGIPLFNVVPLEPSVWHYAAPPYFRRQVLKNEKRKDTSKPFDTSFP